MKKSPVVHFELPAEDKQRVKKFYSEAFGWDMHQLGPEMGDYILATTTDTDDKKMPKTPGSINGGVYQKTEPTQSPRITISVEDIHQEMKAIEQAGGKVLGGMQKSGEPDDIPGVGLYATFIDSEGNTGSILQPSQM